MNAPPPADRRHHARAPVTLLVQYRYDTLADFVAEYATNLSPAGMFLRADAPSPEGTMLHLQFSLKDGSRLIEGLARVVRVVSPGGPAEPGMGVEFVDFDPVSRGVVQRLCEGQP